MTVRELHDRLVQLMIEGYSHSDIEYRDANGHTWPIVDVDTEAGPTVYLLHEWSYRLPDVPHEEDCMCDPCESSRLERKPDETRREYRLRTGREP